MEAAYRILGFPTLRESHSFIRLEVHLEIAKQIIFKLTQSSTKIQRQMNEKSKLEAFFDLNIVDPDAQLPRCSMEIF